MCLWSGTHSAAQPAENRSNGPTEMKDQKDNIGLEDNRCGLAHGRCAIYSCASQAVVWPAHGV
jgi:hypothetical protein